MADENPMDQGRALPPQAAEDARGAATHAHKAAEDLRSAAGETVGEYREKAEQVWGDARDRVRTFKQDAEQYVRENPIMAVFSALGIGFVLGVIICRR
jgi:ElaB/YqjD/DUF883 family membrane-anchored ribosome-binding protein